MKKYKDSEGNIYELESDGEGYIEYTITDVNSMPIGGGCLEEKVVKSTINFNELEEINE